MGRDFCHPQAPDDFAATGGEANQDHRKGEQYDILGEKEAGDAEKEEGVEQITGRDEM